VETGSRAADHASQPPVKTVTSLKPRVSNAFATSRLSRQSPPTAVNEDRLVLGGLQYAIEVPIIMREVIPRKIKRSRYVSLFAWDERQAGSGLSGTTRPASSSFESDISK